jgi:hypothetical protein
MKIEGSPQINVANGILSGWYYQGRNQGIRPRLFEFSSPLYDASSFTPPYDAILPTQGSSRQKYLAVARRLKSITDTITTDRSGKLYYYDRAELYGTCHGFGRNNNTYYDGANFYNAFYAPGYFQPPFGENFSIFKANQETSANLQNGACANINITEYNEQFGIVSKTASDASLSSATLTPNIYSPIYSPREACPPDVAIENYYDEINFTQIPGTTTAIGAGTFYNGNPIPTSLDSHNIKVNGRYRITGTQENRVIVFESGRPEPSYSADNQDSALNNVLCAATTLENNVAAGRGTNGSQLMEAPDVLLGNFNDQVFFPAGLDTAFYYWHFVFRENADTLPFYNNFTAIDTSKTISNRTISQGTQLFKPVLSSDASYWQNRQCPDTVDFLPWNFGASIYACPSIHFDVPYYAATKKFGFYGTRFLNSCKRLNLEHTWSGVPQASELAESHSNVHIESPETEPDDIDEAGNWNFGMYDNLLRTASAEERYSNMYALNKGFFIWANNTWITGHEEYSRLQKVNGFQGIYDNLVNSFQNIFTGGLASFVSGEPQVIVKAGLASTFTTVESGVISDLLFTNNTYRAFRQEFDKIVTGSERQDWYDLENKYAYYITTVNGGLNEPFYANILSGREKRLLTRYMENTVRGNPVDLYPLNHIPFSFDAAKDYLTSTGWGRGLSTPSKNNLPEINRRYFQGAYGNSSEISGLVEKLNALSISDNTAFYPGFFNNINFSKDIPKSSYEPVLSGIIVDNVGRKFSPSGWLAAGYNEIGALDSNFSCFTPIFVQHPVPKLFCKMGQHPTFHALAVDYHSIPDDKISYRYPEIIYWAHKLKLLDDKFKNLYPVKYKWFRVPINEYTSFLASGDFSRVDYANPTGEWACLEGDTQNCTLIHPTECSPTGVLKNVDNYTFIKGASHNKDDKYYYMCLASGRFGIRISEPSELKIEDWVLFDVSLKNGMNQVADVEVTFQVNDVDNATQEVTFNKLAQSAYCGYQQDPYAIPESVIEQKMPPPNAGYGDVTAYRFVGPIGYVGATRSYQPDTLKDTRGLRGAWGRFVEYGALLTLGGNITQSQGELLYGYKHLPKCEGYTMGAGKKGIKVIAKVGGYSVSHWTLPQQAVAALDTRAGMRWDKLTNIGGLYPPITQSQFINEKNRITTANAGYDPVIGGYGIGHWQWGNNLGSIKRFGFQSDTTTNDLIFIGNGAPQPNQIPQSKINEVKEKLVEPDTLAGENCGYSRLGLGRNMLYYLEAFERFYILCGPLKKKNVRNLSFMCPGLRFTNSAIQYFWLGQPNNTFLERRPMYGPYAYQWKVKRHNRDRNGNGASEGFYSMGWSEKYSLLYDAPAIFGLYVKTDATDSYKGQVKRVIEARDKVFTDGISAYGSYRSNWFGVGGNEGTSRPYGNYFCKSSIPSDLCDYISTAQGLGAMPDFKAYTCTESQLNAGQCFDPCISMRYGQGFFPGGKSQNLFGYTSSDSANLGQPKNLRLVPMANKDLLGQVITKDEQSKVDSKVVFRAPVNTPHARVWRGLEPTITSNGAETIVGISACQDGGSDHCNYLTPTIHLKTSAVLLTNSSAFNIAQNFAANIYEDYNIRGDMS